MIIDRTKYEASMAPARARFTSSRWMNRILSPGTPPDLLERFVIEVVSRGVAMVEPAEEWIDSAGTQCTLTGFPELGRALRKHATQEAGRQMLMIADTHALVARRRRQGRYGHPAGLLLGRPATPAVRRYVRLQEETLAGATPYAEIAILFEIERMWAIHGLTLVSHCRESLGRDIVSCLSFLEDHVDLDSRTARFTATELDRLLSSRPETLNTLAAAGSATLSAYAAFFDECVEGALDATDRRAPPSSRARGPFLRSTQAPPSSERVGPPSSGAAVR